MAIARDVTIRLHPIVTEDGLEIGSGSPDNRVEYNGEFQIIGKTESSIRIIDSYSLNSETEKAIRRNTFELKELSSALPHGSSIDYFWQSLKNIVALSRNTGKHSGQMERLLRKMLYANIIAALESLLSDFLIYTVKNDQRILMRIAQNVDEFNSEKFTLRSLIMSDKNLDDRAIKILNSYIYHDLPKISQVYSAAFKITPPNYDKLMVAVSNRHDIVHRNGRRKGEDGERTYQHRDIESLILETQSFALELLKSISTSIGNR